MGEERKYLLKTKYFAVSKDVVRIGKVNFNTKFLGVVLGIILLVIIITAIAASCGKQKDDKQTSKVKGGTFVSGDFDNITDFECVDEVLAVYTDSTGKKGIALLDGTITEEAKYDDIYVVETSWCGRKIVCESEDSEYPLEVDISTGKVSGKQYHKEEYPELDYYWDKETEALVSVDKTGAKTELEPADFGLTAGLYPIKDDESKYGYINQSLVPEIWFNYQGAGKFSEDVAAVNSNGSWGYIDKGGMSVISNSYDDISGDCAYSFSDGLVPVKKGSRCGIINKSEETVVDFAFENILQGKDGKYIAKYDGVWGILTVDKKVRDANTTVATTAPAGSLYIVTTSGDTLNLRDAAGTNSNVISQIPNGTQLTVTETKDGWAHVTYGTTEGWVSADFLKQAG